MIFQLKNSLLVCSARQEKKGGGEEGGMASD